MTEHSISSVKSSVMTSTCVLPGLPSKRFVSHSAIRNLSWNGRTWYLTQVVFLISPPVLLNGQFCWDHSWSRHSDEFKKKHLIIFGIKMPPSWLHPQSWSWHILIGVRPTLMWHNIVWQGLMGVVRQPYLSEFSIASGNQLQAPLVQFADLSPRVCICSYYLLLAVSSGQLQ